MLEKGRYRARISRDPADVEAAQRLRQLCFRGGGPGLDADRFDPLCDHVLVEDAATGRLVACFRFMALDSGRDIDRSYTAQFYNLANLHRYQGRMVEMGRFCIHPEVHDPDVFRIAWATMTQVVDQTDVALLFGCSSFKGVETGDYEDAFALLKERHLAPKRWLPRVKAPLVFRFANLLRLRKPDLKTAMRRMPPLLRTYLLMGGWVSDHAVVDKDLGTLHVFTGLEVKSVPDARKRLLRAI